MKYGLLFAFVMDIKRDELTADGEKTSKRLTLQIGDRLKDALQCDQFHISAKQLNAGDGNGGIKLPLCQDLVMLECGIIAASLIAGVVDILKENTRTVAVSLLHDGGEETNLENLTRRVREKFKNPDIIFVPAGGGYLPSGGHFKRQLAHHFFLPDEEELLGYLLGQFCEL